VVAEAPAALAQIHLALEATVGQERHRVLVVPLFIMVAVVVADHIMEIQAAAVHRVQEVPVEVELVQSLVRVARADQILVGAVVAEVTIMPHLDQLPAVLADLV